MAITINGYINTLTLKDRQKEREREGRGESKNEGVRKRKRNFVCCKHPIAHPPIPFPFPFLLTSLFLSPLRCAVSCDGV